MSVPLAPGAPLGARRALPDRRAEQLHQPPHIRGLLLHGEEEEARQDQLLNQVKTARTGSSTWVIPHQLTEIFGCRLRFFSFHKNH